MSRSFSSSASVFALSLMVLAVAGCQSAPANGQQPTASLPVAAGYEELERRVEMLEGQMKSAQPTLKKVEVMEAHFKTLSLELGRIATTYNVPEIAPVETAQPVSVPVVKKEVESPKVGKVETKPAPTPKKKEIASADAALAVTSVRIGDQPKDVTRIVLDTTRPAEIHYDLDNGEGLLVIDVPKSAWSTTESLTLKKSPMVKSFHASHDDAGAHLVVELKQTAKVVATARLKPSGDSGNRVYVDIAPAK